ncbi:TonB-dependent receptor plug domain-containing protein [Membranihabitans marinus]|uniref:TonB-dependent receptor plug domain-containing protein n=1 Tax=Membranihabitans marinus TaxID=1227546 RepID=UPI001F361468|nr:TonB-dependent receptor [Membranihabitans marinus]
MKRTLFFLLACLPHLLWAQNTTFTITSAQTGEALYLAYIENKSDHSYVNTDAAGKAHLITHIGDSIKVSYVGFKDSLFQIKEVAPQLNIALTNQELATIVIYGQEAYHRNAANGHQDIPMEFLSSLPSFIGTSDVIKSIAFLPGISEGREGYAQLYVRGGDQDQNQILFDGATLYNVNHIGGFISIFHSEMINSVDFYKSYWPSQFGGRLSSVMDIRSAQGNFKEHIQYLDLGFIYSRAKITGPLWKDRISYSLGLRRSLVDLVTGPITKKKRRIMKGNSFNYRFLDFNGRIDARISPQHHLSLSSIITDDHIDFLDGDSDEILINKNSALALNYSFYLNHKTTLKAHASYSKYNHEYLDLEDPSGNIFSGYGSNDTLSRFILRQEGSGNSIQSYKWNVTGETEFNSQIKLNYGIEREVMDYSIFSYRKEEEKIKNVVSTNFALSDTLSQRSISTTAGFADMQYTFNPRWFIKTGIRLPFYNAPSTVRLLPEPKILTTYHLNKNSSFNAAYNYQQQTMALLGYTDLTGHYREYYASANDEIPISTSHQWSLGYFQTLDHFIDRLSVEFYVKRQNNLTKFIPSLDEYQSIIEYPNHLHRNGMNRSLGLELMMQKTQGKLHGSISYTYAHSKAQYPTLNGGRSFAADFDYRHSLNLLVIWKFRKDYKLSGQWIYKSGRPFTVPNSINSDSDIISSNFPIIGEVNNLRMPSYHRLDISLDREWRTKRKDKKQWFGLGVYNAYDKVNPFYVAPEESGQLRVYGFLPLFPTVNFGFEL